MTIEEITRRLAEIRARRAEIARLSEENDADLEGLLAELTNLNAEETALVAEEENLRSAERSRAETRARVAQGLLGNVVSTKGSAKKLLTVEELRKDARYVDAFAAFIKDEHKLPELRMLATELVGSDVTANTVPLPTIVQDTIEYVWQRDSQLIDRARWVEYRGIFEIPYEQSATPAVIHAEGTAAPEEEQLVIGTVKLTPATIKKWLSITDETLKMKGEAFLRYIYEELTHQIILKLENDIVANLIAATNTDGLTSVAVDAAVGVGTVFAGLAGLEADAQRPIVIMNKQLYFNGFMALTDLQGRPIYNIVAENGRPTYYINGVEVVFNNSLPATTTAGQPYAVLGDMDGYTINAPAGRDVEIVADPYTLATEDRVRMIGKLYVGHGISRPGHFVRLVAPTA